MENKRQPIELAEIFSRHASDFLQANHLQPNQKKAFDAIRQCRTATLGGHTDHCDHCGYTRPAYNRRIENP